MSVRVDTATAAAIAEVRPATVRQWLTRGILTRHADGVDVYELLHWIDTLRDTGKARGAVLATHSRHQTRRPSTVVADASGFCHDQATATAMP